MSEQILITGYGYYQDEEQDLQVLIPGYGYKSELPPDFVTIASIAMAQSKLASVAITQSKLTNVTLVR